MFDAFNIHRIVPLPDAHTPVEKDVIDVVGKVDIVGRQNPDAMKMAGHDDAAIDFERMQRPPSPPPIATGSHNATQKPSGPSARVLPERASLSSSWIFSGVGTSAKGGAIQSIDQR